MCTRNHSLQHRTVSIHPDHFKNEDREIPPFGLQPVICPAGHGKSVRPKVIQRDGSGKSGVQYGKIYQIWIGFNLALEISMPLNLSKQLC